MSHLVRQVVLLGAVALGLGCATPARGPAYDFFVADSAEDPWTEKVAEWQFRVHRQGTPELGARSDLDKARVSGLLSQKVGTFEALERRDLAERINHWAREEARRHYRFDAGREPAQDHWPTFPELIEKNGDDCDGLDLIAYHLLHEFGFPESQVYRAIVRRNSDRANHMVTLWFESPEDPWVLDMTGAVSLKMRRFSELEGWTPTKVFNDTRQFRVLERGTDHQAVALE